MKEQKKIKKSRIRYNIKKRNKGLFPRIVIFRSNKNFYAQLICSVSGKVLASYSSISKSFPEKIKSEQITGMSIAKIVGEEFAKICIQGGFQKAVFDRGEYSYNGGRIKSFANSCRVNGMLF